MDKRSSSPFQALRDKKQKKELTELLGVDTLAGGKAGHGPGGAASDQPHASSADVPSRGVALGIALDALVDMFRGYLLEDRTALDRGFEDLVGVLEEWRDAVPKA